VVVQGNNFSWRYLPEKEVHEVIFHIVLWHFTAWSGTVVFRRVRHFLPASFHAPEVCCSTCVGQRRSSMPCQLYSVDESVAWPGASTCASTAADAQ